MVIESIAEKDLITVMCCAGRHLAWQPPPLVYECTYELVQVALDKSVY